MKKITETNKNHWFKLACTALLLLSLQLAEAKIWYVGTTTQWASKAPEDVKATVKEAWDLATNAGDEIWIAEGTYSVPSLTIKDVAVYGSFAGTESTINDRGKKPNGKAWEFTHPSVIKNSAAQVFEKTNTVASTFILDGITFDDGTTNNRRVVETANSSINSKNRISNCIFKNYRNNADGTVLRLRDKTEVYNCLITNNTNTGNGTIYADFGTVIHDCEIVNNTVSAGGGGISAVGITGSAASAYTVHVYNCLINNNTATNTTGGAGGIVVNNARVHDCIIVNNTGYAGGIAFDIRYNSTVWNVVVANNKTTSIYGGITFNVNSTSPTAGIKALVNSIVYNNTNNGGNVANFSLGTGGATGGARLVQNCIIDGADYSSVGTFTNNIVETNFADIFADNVKWIISPTGLAMNAGTATIPYAAAGGTSAPGSITLTTANKDFANGPRIQSGAVDIGPYELISVGTISAGTGATITGVTLNGATVSTSGFYAVYGDELKISFTKTNTTPACNMPEAVITTDNDDCEATIVITEPLGDIQVSSGTPRTVSVTYPVSITNVNTTASGANPYTVADGAPFALTFEYDDLPNYQPVTNTGVITGTRPNYTLTVPSVTSNININITVAPVAVTGIALDKSTITLSSGNFSDRLFATVSPSDAFNKNISWSSSDPAKVKVNNEGQVTPVGAGQATITATTEDGGLEASCTVTVNGNIKASAFEPLEDTYSNMGATTTNYGTSDRMLVADGGTNLRRYAYLKFSIKDLMENMQDPESVRIKLPLWMIGFNNTGTAPSGLDWVLSGISNTSWTEDGLTWSNQPSGTLTEIARYKPLSYTNATDPDMCAVFDITDYVLEQYKNGIETITLTVRPVHVNGTAQSYGAYFASKEHADASKHPLIVISYVGVESVALDETEITLGSLNSTATLTVTILPGDAYNQNVTWSSSVPAVATVSNSEDLRAATATGTTLSATITALSSGTTIITATTADGAKVASCTVTVDMPTGLSEAVEENTVLTEKFYTVMGIEVVAPTAGSVFIKKTVFENGKTVTEKVFNK